MTAKQKSILEDWGTWAFRAIVVAFCTMIYAEAKVVRRDVKLLMEEKGAIQTRVSRAEKDIERVEDNVDNLYHSLTEHKINHD